jgi:hypothetical protein
MAGRRHAMNQEERQKIALFRFGVISPYGTVA